MENYQVRSTNYPSTGPVYVSHDHHHHRKYVMPVEIPEPAVLLTQQQELIKPARSETKTVIKQVPVPYPVPVQVPVQVQPVAQVAPPSSPFVTHNTEVEHSSLITTTTGPENGPRVVAHQTLVPHSVGLKTQMVSSDADQGNFRIVPSQANFSSKS